MANYTTTVHHPKLSVKPTSMNVAAVGETHAAGTVVDAAEVAVVPHADNHPTLLLTLKRSGQQSLDMVWL
jgi:hypothetical protein